MVLFIFVYVPRTSFIYLSRICEVSWVLFILESWSFAILVRALSSKRRSTTSLGHVVFAYVSIMSFIRVSSLPQVARSTCNPCSCSVVRTTIDEFFGPLYFRLCSQNIFHLSFSNLWGVLSLVHLGILKSRNSCSCSVVKVTIDDFFGPRRLCLCFDNVFYSRLESSSCCKVNLQFLFVLCRQNDDRRILWSSLFSSMFPEHLSFIFLESVRCLESCSSWSLEVLQFLFVLCRQNDDRRILWLLLVIINVSITSLIYVLSLWVLFALKISSVPKSWKRCSCSVVRTTIDEFFDAPRYH
jgi:hypothetical protein